MPVRICESIDAIIPGRRDCFHEIGIKLLSTRKANTAVKRNIKDK